MLYIDEILQTKKKILTWHKSQNDNYFQQNKSMQCHSFYRIFPCTFLRPENM